MSKICFAIKLCADPLQCEIGMMVFYLGIFLKVLVWLVLQQFRVKVQIVCIQPISKLL